jgi:inosine/xanthosine triphosphatase
MIIAVGTENKAKIKAVEKAIKDAWGDTKIVPVAVDSGVAKQPTSDNEAIDGAIVRAQNALKLIRTAKYGIGLEGTVDVNNHGMFLRGWTVIMDRKGTTGIGSSGSVILPNFLAKGLAEGKELGPLIQQHLSDTHDEIRHTLGTNGVLTKGLYDRVREFEDATRCALARFVSRKLYEK